MIRRLQRRPGQISLLTSGIARDTVGLLGTRFKSARLEQHIAKRGRPSSQSEDASARKGSAFAMLLASACRIAAKCTDDMRTTSRRLSDNLTTCLSTLQGIGSRRNRDIPARSTQYWTLVSWFSSAAIANSADRPQSRSSPGPDAFYVTALNFRNDPRMHQPHANAGCSSP